MTLHDLHNRRSAALRRAMAGDHAAWDDIGRLDIEIARIRHSGWRAVAGIAAMGFVLVAVTFAAAIV